MPVVIVVDGAGGLAHVEVDVRASSVRHIQHSARARGEIEQASIGSLPEMPDLTLPPPSSGGTYSSV